MSFIKISYEGPTATLAKMLAAVSDEDTYSPQVAAPAIGPQNVSVQKPPPVLTSLHPPDPVYGALGPQGPGGQNLAESVPAPSDYPPMQQEIPTPGFDFGKLPLEPEAWSTFREFLAAWMVGFSAPVDDKGDPTVEQPDRLQLLKDLGSGQWAIHILRWCAHYRSLQGAIFHALLDLTLVEVGEEKDVDLTDRVSANVTQVAHAAFPDIEGFHDYSTKWKRQLQEGQS
jgi:hypothetical protein